ncbi:MAG TPA: ABC transporter permease [Kiloniellaceae bacterium]|nr:ABC transporter permease [Kiloniellaceae bacterium]
MLVFLVRRLGTMILTMIVVSIILFLMLEVNSESVAIKVLGPYSAPESREIWLEQHGYNDPLVLRYVRWLGNFVIGDFGESVRFKTAVSDVLWPRLGNTGILAAVTLAIVTVIGLTLGVFAGMKEGSLTDRGISIISIITTSVPEFASAVLLSAVFVFYLGILPGTSSMTDGFDPIQLVLPVMVLVLYDFGYVTRMTRASMAEVMMTHYIRTAVLKGLPYKTVIRKHALRNALIAPFTVIMLQINWLLSGVIVVEFFYAYKGFGALLLEASLNQDIFLIEACAMISVFVAVATQTLADVGYTYLNPRIRFS